MSLFCENRFLGSFLVALGISLLLAACLLLNARSEFNAASDQLAQRAAEFNRLQSLNPFPNQANLVTMKAQGAEYEIALGKLKDDLKRRVLPVMSLAPNEFQARLRKSVTAVVEKARANKVKLPDNFFLGFEEFAAALPSNALAPLLAQQLAQIELLSDILIEARIDGLTSFSRPQLPEAHPAPATPTASASRARNSAVAPAVGSRLLQHTVVETTFVSTPSAARRVLNQIAGAREQFFIIRTLHVLNERDKGPPRAAVINITNPTAINAPALSASPSAKPNATLDFIVGTEHIQTSVNIELVSFTF